jgi:hypothetical protein
MILTNLLSFFHVLVRKNKMPRFHFLWLPAAAGMSFFFFLSCSNEPPSIEPVVELPEKKLLHYFAVVGHAYGNAESYTQSIYPPFLEKFKADHAKHPYEELYLTGDVVARGTDTNWNTVIAELNALNIPWWIAPGNHDVGPDACFGGSPGADSLFSSNHYFFGKGTRTLMYVLNTTNNGWTTDPVQRNTIIDQLSRVDMDTVDNIFVFTHQLWWQRNTPDSLWQDAFPYFVNTGVETWFFAGDLGAHESLPFYYEDHFDRYHFYASGVGGGVGDSYFRVSVYEDGDVEIERVNF